MEHRSRIIGRDLFHNTHCSSLYIRNYTAACRESHLAFTVNFTERLSSLEWSYEWSRARPNTRHLSYGHQWVDLRAASPTPVCLEASHHLWQFSPTCSEKLPGQNCSLATRYYTSDFTVLLNQWTATTFRIPSQFSSAIRPFRFVPKRAALVSRDLGSKESDIVANTIFRKEGFFPTSNSFVISGSRHRLTRARAKENVGLFPRAVRAVVTAPRSPKTSLDLVPRGNKRFRRGEQQESFVTLMTGSFGRMGNLELAFSLSPLISLYLPFSLSLFR